VVQSEINRVPQRTCLSCNHISLIRPPHKLATPKTVCGTSSTCGQSSWLDAAAGKTCTTLHRRKKKLMEESLDVPSGMLTEVE
jgi:hypothetical protein